LIHTIYPKLAKFKILSSTEHKNLNNNQENQSEPINSGPDILENLRATYGNNLSRDLVDTVDRSKLSHTDKETLRKLKISIANKGRKPWNFGKRHKTDTVNRIRERTREAMCRTEVRERWATSWKPKTHTEETKKKLRSIMLQKEKEKLADMAEWLRKEMGIDIITYENLVTRFRYSYRRAFNSKLKIKFINNEKGLETLTRASYKTNIHLLSTHKHEVHKKECAKIRTELREENVQQEESVEYSSKISKSLKKHRKGTKYKRKFTKLKRPKSS